MNVRSDILPNQVPNIVSHFKPLRLRLGKQTRFDIRRKINGDGHDVFTL
jgi:hypothetical protein